jgi:hypothetical protein
MYTSLSLRGKSANVLTARHDVVGALRPGALSPRDLLSTRSPTSANGSEWQGEDLNLRPSGYEAREDRLPGFKRAVGVRLLYPSYLG